MPFDPNLLLAQLLPWQTLIAGLLAVIAALFVVSAAARQSRAERTAARRADQFESRGVATAILGETTAIISSLEAARTTMRETDVSLKLRPDEKRQPPYDIDCFWLGDRSVYKAYAASLGRLPYQLVASVAMFYGLIEQWDRVARSARTLGEQIRTLKSVGPTILVEGQVLRAGLTKYLASASLLDQYKKSAGFQAKRAADDPW
jgi:hypothetical protein